MLEKANQFVSFKFGDVQLLDLLNFPQGARSLAFFLKAYTISETKRYFQYEWFNDPEKLNNTQLPPYGTFFSKMCNDNPLKKTIQTFKVSSQMGA